MNDILLVFGGLGCVAGIGLLVGALLTVALTVMLPVRTWQQLHQKSRTILWMYGLDWPEIRRTYKRLFYAFYARHLPEYMPASAPSSSLPEEELDESGGVPPADSLQMSLQTEPPSSGT